jgi:hypothetical protein
METSSILTDPRYRNSTFASDPFLGRRPRGFRPGVQPGANIGTLADALAAQQLAAQQAPRPAPNAPAQMPAYIDPTNPGAIAAGAQQAYQGAQATKQFNRQIAPNLPSALLPDEVNATRFAYLNQLAAQTAGGPSVQTNDMLSAPAVIGTGANGRPSLTQNPASLLAAAQGLTPQSWNQQRTTELANAYAESMVPQPRTSTLSFEGGTKINILTDANGNTRVIEPPKEDKPTTTQLDRYYAELDTVEAAAASATDPATKARLTARAQGYQTAINNYIARGGKEAPMDFAEAGRQLRAGMLREQPAPATPATPAATAPAPQPAPAPSPATPPPANGKPYSIEGQNIRFTGTTAQERAQSINQAYMDGHLDPVEAQKLIVQLGFKLKAPAPAN